MKISTKYQVKGAFHVMKGAARTATGKIFSNRWLGVKGKFESLTGRVQWKVGKAMS
jgi:uncharacterized protein YjbJ (UPF0337 family)